jgi:hypothetical protein
LIDLCTRRPWWVIAISVLLAVGASVYTARHFAINTDVTRLISPNLPWRQRELTFNATFPQGKETIIAVIDARTSEGASKAAQSLTAALAGRKELIRSVEAAAESPFFAREAMLYLTVDEIAATTGPLQQSAPLVGVLAADPSLRGLAQALTFGLRGGQAGEAGLAPLSSLLNQAAAALDAVLIGKPGYFSWREAVSGKTPEESELRRFVEIHPVLNFSALEPGKAASDAIRKTVADLKLNELGARVRLTGSVPIADEEFATIADGALPNLIATIVVVLIILWLALRSARIIVAVFITVAIGLAITAAAGLMMVGALNLISVAFAVLFVGIGVDFGIQFSVRYRAERHDVDDLRLALSNAGEHIAIPLALAAAATAAGFLSFVPTAYRGVSELGQIAGLGMIIAFLGSITVLPALLMIFNPSGESEPLGYAALAPVDNFMERHRMPILIGSAAVVIAALPLLYYLKFDFNPIDLRNPNAESIATYLDVRSDPAVGANGVDVLASSQRDAAQIAQRLGKVPEVSSVRTIASFVPADQDKKLALINGAARALLPALGAARRPPPPSDKDNVDALKGAQRVLERAAGNDAGAGSAAAKRLAADLGQLAAADQALRERAQAVFITPLQTALEGLRNALQPQPVNERTLPASLRQQWLTPDGRARVEVLPTSALNENPEIQQFARAVLAVEPRATGGPIAILESGDTIIRAFIEAGLWALLSITVLLWLTLRRVGDMLRTIIPLLVAGVVTLELCVAFGMPLNFANIIALPLLLGIGVAFKIYYVMAWRGGQSQVLQSPLTRAVFFSALTTATAFGSLWFSNHPGTSSMGKLLALSLVCTLAAAVLFQPVLMGPPRNARANVRGGGARRRARRARTVARLGLRRLGLD